MNSNQAVNNSGLGILINSNIESLKANFDTQLNFYLNQINELKNDIKDLKAENKQLIKDLAKKDSEVKEATGGLDLGQLLEVAKLFKGGNSKGNGLLDLLNKKEGE